MQGKITKPAILFNIVSVLGKKVCLYACHQIWVGVPILKTAETQRCISRMNGWGLIRISGTWVLCVPWVLYIVGLFSCIQGPCWKCHTYISFSPKLLDLTSHSTGSLLYEPKCGNNHLPINQWPKTFLNDNTLCAWSSLTRKQPCLQSDVYTWMKS